MAQQRARVLIVGTGGVGTMSAYALEQGGKAEVTAVMRSNYDAVKKNGVRIDSVQYGNGINGWRPTKSELNLMNSGVLVLTDSKSVRLFPVSHRKASLHLISF